MKGTNKTKRGFFVHYLRDNPFPDEIIELESYINTDGYLVGIYTDGQHYASPTVETPRICLQFPVPKNKRV